MDSQRVLEICNYCLTTSILISCGNSISQVNSFQNSTISEIFRVCIIDEYTNCIWKNSNDSECLPVCHSIALSYRLHLQQQQGLEITLLTSSHEIVMEKYLTCSMVYSLLIHVGFQLWINEVFSEHSIQPHSSRESLTWDTLNRNNSTLAGSFQLILQLVVPLSVMEEDNENQAEEKICRIHIPEASAPSQGTPPPQAIKVLIYYFFV